ncbi:MAG TPA: alpha-hydroxy acid oxidase [Candidatus Dormibacteraeota bacterium]|nr:alpha-hydroxy acid oxidase [Candidatus Dormibacteraeota bacterium]
MDVEIPWDPVELEEAARRLLPEIAHAYYASGAGLESSVAANPRAWARWWLRPRVLVDVSAVSTATEVLGTPVRLPVLIAPCAFHRLAHPEAEAATARAAAAAGTVMIVSTHSSLPLERIAPQATAGAWFQLYADPDPAVTERRVRGAEEAGCGALVITVDAPVWGVRYRGLADGVAFAELVGSSAVSSGASTFLALDWGEIERIAASTALPVVLKGILHPEDARRAARAGAAAVVVSNHGGRQLDGAIPPALALPGVVAAAAGQLEVYVDGGVRCGSDVLRALALGARAVLIGRPYLWALTIGGEAGVLALLRRLGAETANAMALAGQTDASGVEAGIVVDGGAPLS